MADLYMEMRYQLEVRDLQSSGRLLGGERPLMGSERIHFEVRDQLEVRDLHSKVRPPLGGEIPLIRGETPLIRS